MQGPMMAALRDRLVRALDRDPPQGWFSRMRADPLAKALEVARGHEPDALRATEAILAAGHSSARVRRNAVPLLVRLHLSTDVIPSAEEIYRASQRGESFDPHRGLKQSLSKLLGDADLEVGVAAAIELVQLADPGELPALRQTLAPLLPALRERRGQSALIQSALLTLGAVPEISIRLNEVASGTGGLPADFELLLAALEKAPHESFAPALARLFPRLEVIAGRRDPKRIVVGGTIPAWDADTLQAVRLFKLQVRLTPIAEMATVAAQLRVATPAMAILLLSELGDLAARGAALAKAAAADEALTAPVRERARVTVGGFARGTP